jgi:hypothetical protein
MTSSAASSALPQPPDFDLTFTDEHDVVHLFLNVHTMPGDAATACGWSVRDAFTSPYTNDAPTAVSCLPCLGHDPRYTALRRRMIRLRGER